MDEKALLILASGQDRPGIVDRLSGALLELGANLEDSRMALLGGEFALIVLVTGAADVLARVERDLPGRAQDLGLVLRVKRTGVPAEEDRPVGEGLCYRLSAVSMDHPGIVHRISRVLSECGANVVRLDTRVSRAPVSGTPVFSLEIEAQVPAEVKVADLRARLEGLAAEENIDIDLRPSS